MEARVANLEASNANLEASNAKANEKLGVLAKVIDKERERIARLKAYRVDSENALRIEKERCLAKYTQNKQTCHGVKSESKKTIDIFGKILPYNNIEKTAKMDTDLNMWAIEQEETCHVEANSSLSECEKGLNENKKYLKKVEITCINQPIESAYCSAAMSKKSITGRFGTRQQRERERIETCAPVFKELTDMFTDMYRGKPYGPRPRGGRLGKQFNNGHPIKLGTSAKISNGVAPLIWFKRWVFCRKIYRCRYSGSNKLLRGVDYRSRQNWKQHVFDSQQPMCTRWRPNYPKYFSVGAGDKCKNRSENCINGRDV
jgi:hypothetical protein